MSRPQTPMPSAQAVAAQGQYNLAGCRVLLLSVIEDAIFEAVHHGSVCARGWLCGDHAKRYAELLGLDPDYYITTVTRKLETDAELYVTNQGV